MTIVEDTFTQLKADAAHRTGLSDFGDSHYEAALMAWSDDLLHAPLSEFGRSFLERLAVRNLMTRLRVHDWLRRYPEIDEVQLPPIILIVGPPRTGTTLLHNLMALHKQTRPLLRWELVEPVPPPEVATYTSDPRIEKVQQSLQALRGSQLERMHWVNADEPEECPWGWVDCRGLLGQGCFASMPTWTDHLRQHDFTATYTEQARLMRLRLWRNPAPDGAVLLLKSPQTTEHLRAFCQAFPNARLVLTHRDPYRALLSGLTVVDTINAPFCEGAHALSDDGREQRLGLRNLRTQLDRLVQTADRADVASIDLNYAALMADPEGAVTQALEAAGLSTDPDLGGLIRRFLAAQKAGRRAAPPRSYDDYGYDYDQVHRDPSVSRYVSRFKVEAERQRLSATRVEG